MDLFTAPSLSLHLPLFALLLMIAIIAEIALSRKQISLKCSHSTMTLLLATGLAGFISIYQLQTSCFKAGDRILISAWHYPIAVAIILAITLPFLSGVRTLIRKRRFAHGIIRCLIFAASLYFSITVAVTPTRVNKALERAEQTLRD